MIIRSDRTLTIRPPSYTGAEPIIIAQNSEDVLNIIRQGRIRYLVTCFTTDTQLDRTEEMVLLHDTVQSQAGSFALIGEFPLLVEFGTPSHFGQVFLWKFLGELPEGPSEIPVIVPTAN